MKNFLLASFFAVLTGVGGMLSIPLPPVPFSMQTFVVLMSGLLLGPKFGPLSQVFYTVMGLIGLPVFAGGSGGLHALFSPTFGFLIGFAVQSWIAGLLAPRAGTFPRYALTCLAATAGLYAVGLPLLYLNLNYVTGTGIGLASTFRVALLPFVLPDMLKAAAAAWLAARTVPLLRDAGLLSLTPVSSTSGGGKPD